MTIKDQQKIKVISDKVAKAYKPEKIILFGSYATGKADQFSDFDFLIIKQTKDRYFDRAKMVHRIIGLSLPADILVYTPEEFEAAKDSFFIQEILKEGKTLYEAS